MTDQSLVRDELERSKYRMGLFAHAAAVLGHRFTPDSAMAQFIDWDAELLLQLAAEAGEDPAITRALIAFARSPSSLTRH